MSVDPSSSREGTAGDITARREAESDIERQRRHYEAILNNTPDLAYIFDPNHRFIYANGGLLRMWGKTWDEAIGKSCLELGYEPWHAAMHDREIDQVIATKQPIRGEVPFSGTFGRRVYDYIMVPVFGADGEVEAVAGTTRDITDRKLSEETVRFHGERFETLIKNAPLGVFLLNSDLRIEEVNPVAIPVFGDMPGGIVGRQLEEVVARLLEPELGNQIVEMFRHTLATGESLVTGEQALFRIDRGLTEYYEWRIERLTLPNGHFGLVCYLRDVSGQVKTSQAIAESNERLASEAEHRKVGELAQARLAAIIESSDDAIISKNLDGTIVSWNRGAEKLFGYTAEEAVGHSILLIVPPQRHDEERTILARLREGQKVDHFETQRLTKDGRHVEISLSVSPIRDSTGLVVGASKIARDVTDRKRLEKERESLLDAERKARENAQRINTLKDEFLATLSHELRTPLNAIMGWAQLLSTGKLDPAEFVEAGSVIERNARTQKQLIDDLLDMSRIISGKLRLDLQRILPVDFIEAAIETILPSANAKGVRIEKMLDPVAGPIAGDPARLQQVLWNILINAVKFTPKGGKIQILLERVNSHLELTVADNGEGIDSEFLPHLFERFRQADATTTRRHGGLGLGLAIVKQITELHGGQVSAMSAGKGTGSTFVIRLPILVLHSPDDAADRFHPRASATVTEGRLTDLSNLKILVVDDEPDARELVRRLLVECGAIVSAVESAAAALALLAAEAHDVLVSDIGMPEMDGYELLRLIRKSESAARIPAVALTAFARSEDRTRAMRAGYIAHVAKPVEPAELLATIAVVTGRPTAI